MALGVTGTMTIKVRVQGGGIGGVIGDLIQRAIPIFLAKVANALAQEIARVMPYSRRPGRRPKPPRSKTGRAVKSLRAVRRGNSVIIYGVDYLNDLRRGGWDFLTPAWRNVEPRLQSLFNEAIREVQSGSRQ